MMFIGLLLIGFVIYYIMADGGKKSLATFSQRSAEDILKERFINGEIDDLTYLKMKETLKK